MSYLTEEMKELAKTAVSVRTYSQPVTADGLRRFAQAAMEENSLFNDAREAQASRFGAVVCPPLYPLHHARRESGTADPLDRAKSEPDWDGADADSLWRGLPVIDVPLTRHLNGGTEAQFYQLAEVGDLITETSVYAALDEKSGKNGPLVITTMETKFENQRGELLLTVRTTVIRR